MPQLTWEWRAKLCKIRSQVVQFSLRCSYFWRRGNKSNGSNINQIYITDTAYCIRDDLKFNICRGYSVFRGIPFFSLSLILVCLFGWFLFVLLCFFFFFSLLVFLFFFFCVFIVPTFKAIMSLNFLLIGLFLTLYYRKPFQTWHSVS